MSNIADHPAIQNAERWGYPHRPMGEDMYDDGIHYIEDDYAIGLKSYEEDMATDPYDDLPFEELTDELPVTDPYLKRLQEYIENEGCWGE